MYYYEVLVSSSLFRGQEPLTYSSDSKLRRGSVVLVPLRNAMVAGVVLRSIPKPSFDTKPIAKQLLEHPLPEQALRLIDWLVSYYPAPLGVFGQLIMPGSLSEKKDLSPPPLPDKPLSSNKKPSQDQPLSKEQQEVISSINNNDKDSTFLLHGVTGSGKTRVYMELAQQVLSSGSSVLILTPEIGLTSQLVNTIKQQLSAPVIVVHSGLTPAQKRGAWLQILRSDTPVVVVGPRSALFSPIKGLGLIVMDEAHDSAYKQEQAPYYQATRVAGQLAKLHGAKLVLGTATPPVSEYWIAENKHTPILRLKDLPGGKQPERLIEVINIRDRSQFSRSAHLSTALLDKVGLALEQKQQSLVFLNRRGTARIVACQACDWKLLCPHCDLPLTYHGDSHSVRCHTCGYKKNPPASCGNCGSTDITYKSIGTKAIADELKKQFPGANIKRFDTDNIKSEKLDRHYDSILEGKVDIIVGTQILAKGLDLPKLSVVGIVVADTNMYFPDYSSDEQTYQLLSQVIGRVGRGHVKGSVVIQSYSPHSTAIKAAVEENWSEFYRQQIAERKAYGFPPFYYFMKLTCARSSNRNAEITGNKLADKLSAAGLRIKIIGPAPSFWEKRGNKYYWQIVAKARDRSELTKIVPLLPSGWTYNLDPTNLL